MKYLTTIVLLLGGLFMTSCTKGELPEPSIEIVDDEPAELNDAEAIVEEDLNGF